MRAVEQQHVRLVAARRGAKARDERVLAAGDASQRRHGVEGIALWYHCPTMAETMKERLIKKFEDEIQALDHELKLELPKEIKRARELGDLRENAEYQAAKERQRLVEARISMLQKRVAEIALINVDRIPDRPRRLRLDAARRRRATARSWSFSWSCPRTPTPRRG